MSFPWHSPPRNNEGPDALGGERPASVAELTAIIKEVLEAGFPNVWVEGEISNLSRPRSGHIYFTLKDDRAQLPAVMWRSSVGRLAFEPVDGLRVACRGSIEVYPPHGRYQLIARSMREEGVGPLELAFRKLFERLKAEGLFESERKTPIPEHPRRIAVMTSPSGAAIHDFLQVLRRRRGGIDIVVVPVRVQGKGAAEEIAEALTLVNRARWEPPIDAIIVTRGGGSLEDLWAFNEEVLVRAVAASRLPVISAVGHEVDVTLCDLAADLRALTPSEAAERIAPSMERLAQRWQHSARRLHGAALTLISHARARVELAGARNVYRRPTERLHELARSLDYQERRLQIAMQQRLSGTRRRLEASDARLAALSPLAILARGYSITTNHRGDILRDSKGVEAGEEIVTRLAHGRLTSRITDSTSETP